MFDIGFCQKLAIRYVYWIEFWTITNYFKTNFSGGLANRGDSECVEDIKSDWKFADGSGWSKDPLLEASCEKDQSGKK